MAPNVLACKLLQFSIEIFISHLLKLGTKFPSKISCCLTSDSSTSYESSSPCILQKVIIIETD